MWMARPLRRYRIRYRQKAVEKFNKEFGLNLTEKEIFGDELSEL
jgi:hypothetical protein